MVPGVFRQLLPGVLNEVNALRTRTATGVHVYSYFNDIQFYAPRYAVVLLPPGILTITEKPVLRGPYIKETPSNKRTPAAWVPKFSSHIYCKTNLYSADLSIKADTSESPEGVRLIQVLL